MAIYLIWLVIWLGEAVYKRAGGASDGWWVGSSAVPGRYRPMSRTYSRNGPRNGRITSKPTRCTRRQSMYGTLTGLPNRVGCGQALRGRPVQAPEHLDVCPPPNVQDDTNFAKSAINLACGV